MNSISAADKRAVVYQRAKMVLDKRPFGTQYDVYAEGFEWLRHSMAPRPLQPRRSASSRRSDCPRPYDASIFNIGHELRRLEPNVFAPSTRRQGRQFRP